MTIQITVALNEARLQAVANFLDSGALGGRIRLYGGTRPASVNDAPGTPMLAEIPLDEPSGTVGSNQLTLTASEQGQAVLSGVATWARFVNGNGDTALDGDVSDLAGSGDVKIDDTVLWVGGFVALISAVLA